jgi:hypothetical protein
MKSALCTQESISSEAYQKWAHIFGSKGHMHRKVWEWAFISECLSSSGFLMPGRYGLGFACGTEPLAAIFAAQGAELICTDLATEDANRKGWSATNQHASSKAKLNERGLCESQKFNKLVTFEFLDMNNIPSSYFNRFDFNWSSCAFEHLGGIRQGLDFVVNSMETLKPGGIGVHTTEFNVSSDEDTLESEGLSIFRKRDILQLVNQLQGRGYEVAEIDWNYGSSPLDYYADFPPYKHNPHLKLILSGYVTTSIGLIVRRPF